MSSSKHHPLCLSTSIPYAPLARLWLHSAAGHFWVQGLSRLPVLMFGLGCVWFGGLGGGGGADFDIEVAEM